MREEFALVTCLCLKIWTVIISPIQKIIFLKEKIYFSIVIFVWSEFFFFLESFTKVINKCYFESGDILNSLTLLFELFDNRYIFRDFPGGSDVKVSAYNVGDPGSIPGSGRSGEGNGNPLQYSAGIFCHMFCIQ